MQKIKKINFFIEKQALDNTVEKIYELVRSKNYLLKDTSKVIATKLRNFVTVMKTWGWNVYTDDLGNVISIDYFGHEPLNYQKILFDKIAPHVQPGSFIKFETNEGKEAWEFDGQNLVMK